MADDTSKKETYQPEQSSAPKNFAIRCLKCRWARLSSGLTVDLQDLIEVKSNCAGCGKFKKYKCPKCGTACPLKRIKGNS
jgi:hypothetical protein